MRAYSAGGVVFRTTSLRMPTQDDLLQRDVSDLYAEADGMNIVEVALVGRSHSGIWALPKGTPQPGETTEQVAVREAQEETGLLVRLIAYIGSISYTFVRDSVRYHKQVRHYLLEAIGGDTSLHDAEYDVVQWFSLHEAGRHLTYHNEVHILYQAEDLLHTWLQQQHRAEST